MNPFARLTRREMLQRASLGFGGLALAGILADQAQADALLLPRRPLARQPPHLAPRVKRVVLLWMDGGVSQVDSFDPKPQLQADDGQPFKMKIETTQFEDNGKTLGSPFPFQQYGMSGIPVSSLFPHIASCADELCVIRSMQTSFAEHAQSCYMLHTGHPMQGRPSLGSWLSYGLGTECGNLPSYVVINGGQLPLGGLPNYSSGFLPAIHEASLFHMGAKVPLLDNVEPVEKASGPQAEIYRRRRPRLRGPRRIKRRPTGIGNPKLRAGVRHANRGSGGR